MISTGKLDPLDFPQFAIDQFGIKEIDLFDRAMPPVSRSSKRGGCQLPASLLDGGKGSLDGQTARSVDGLKRLADYAATKQGLELQRDYD
jgi:hypothetical protein